MCRVHPAALLGYKSVLQLSRPLVSIAYNHGACVAYEHSRVYEKVHKIGQCSRLRAVTMLKNLLEARIMTRRSLFVLSLREYSFEI